MLQEYYAWIDRVFGLSIDSDLLKAQKRIVLSMLFVAIPMILAFVFFFFLFSQFFFYPGLIVLGFLVLSIANLVALAYWKNFQLFVWVLVFGIILLATGIHIVQGGFYNSSGTIFYALIAPSFAATGISRKAGSLVLGVYISIILLLYAFEKPISELGPSSITDSIILTLVAVNLCAVGFFVLTTLLLLITEINTALVLSDNLLLNILPMKVAQELKRNGKVSSQRFDQASILFSDFVEFTRISSTMEFTLLVSELNICFKAFDQIMEKYKIEKIKTIGDAYMAAGGLPEEYDESVKNTVLAALEMQEFIEARSQEQMAKDQPHFQMRVGIHTGPVVAGIVGVKKFQYDVWGDTVNTASRIESAGEVGKVNISQATYELLAGPSTSLGSDEGSASGQSQFSFESRGKIEVKGKGEISMYFVTKN